MCAITYFDVGEHDKSGGCEHYTHKYNSSFPQSFQLRPHSVRPTVRYHKGVHNMGMSYKVRTLLIIENIPMAGVAAIRVLNVSTTWMEMWLTSHEMLLGNNLSLVQCMQ